MATTLSSDFLLIRGSTILTVDPENGNLDNCDILIHKDRIAAIGQNLQTPLTSEATVIDAQGCIIIPGFVNGHHHMWQQLLRGIATDWSLFDYLVNMRNLYGSLYTPEDVYLATYVAALSLLNNGVTTVLEPCHIINSPEHADAAVKALKDAGIRGTFCYGFYPNTGPSGDVASEGKSSDFPYSARLVDAARVRKQHFARNDPAEELLTFGIAPNEPESQSVEQTINEIAESRQLGARIITMHLAMGPSDGAHRQVVQQLDDAGCLGPDLVFSHGASLTDSEMEAIQTSEAGLVGTPDTELQMGMGFPAVFRARDKGCRTCLGLDITSNQGNDFIAQMRLALQAQRAQENEKGFPISIARKTSEVLRMGTLGGSEVMQPENLIGSISVGKKADLVILRCDDIETIPVLDPTSTVVFHSSSRHIDTVIVDGKIKKQHGELVADWLSLRDEVRRRAGEIQSQAAGYDISSIREKWFKILTGPI